MCDRSSRLREDFSFHSLSTTSKGFNAALQLMSSLHGNEGYKKHIARDRFTVFDWHLGLSPL